MKKIFILIIATLYLFASPYNQEMLENISQTNSKKNSFSFAIMGDNRNGDRVLEKIISKINQDRNISFIINNGDLVTFGYKKEFNNYLHIIKNSNKPILSIIGNHELPWYEFLHPTKNYKKIFGKTDFSFSYANSYFIILDSSVKSLTKKQCKWLKEELEKSQQYKNRFVITHVPLYDPRKGEYKKGHSFNSISKAKKLNDLFDKYRVTMLFTSHIHFYYRGVWQKTPFIITGGAGAPLKDYSNSGFYHYIKVIVNDNNIEYKVIKI
ncbi:Metallophosphoesterase, calcineurin superfamily [hydrothermal vent metagenome]|uniref:Metallophosphoesterase, calcineurin superfamily n=1 Tax=hydrothermal vent metagenome TaxID=652676 RepID=A0A1W1EI33_9ZZZZ